MTLLDAQDWTFPVPVAYGPGRLREIADFARTARMTNPLIVTDRGSQGLPFIADLQTFLEAGGLMSGLFAEISPNPRDDEIAAGCRLYRSGGHDGIIAIGGGSGMDGGKAVCLTAANGIDLWDFEYEKSSPDIAPHAPFPPLITIPTTAGSGAETESTAMVTDTARLMKFCIWHPALKPATAILDPETTVGLPATLTAWTGCDAMIHAIEVYCVPDFHPMCDGMALEGLRLTSAWLRTAVMEPESIEARGGMLVGSCLAGVSFLKGLGLVHAISHMVGAEYDTHHGLTNAVVLPSVLRFNEMMIAHKIPPMAEAMGLKSRTFDGFYQSICGLLDDLDIPKTLAEIGVPGDCATSIAEKAALDSAAQTNPRTASVPELQSIIEEALSHGR